MRLTLGRWMIGAAVSLGLSGVALGQDDPVEPEAPETTEEAEMEDTVYVLMKTSEGDITLALNNEKAPISVENFLQYAEDKGYDGTVFHRVISTFMIQGGGFEPDGTKREPRAPIKNEWKNGLSNTRYSIAMARLGGRADSATNQFFINVSDNAFLDQPRDGAGYAVFGEVVEGFETIETIKGVPTGQKQVRGGTMSDWPIAPVVIEEVRPLTEEEEAALLKRLEEGASSGG